MAHLSEKQVRENIAAIISSTLADAKILKRNPYTQAADAWLGAFTHKFDYGLGNGLEPVTHAWFTRRYRLESGVMTKEDLMSFQIMGFMKHSYGTDLSNSEDIFQANIDLLSDKLKDDSNWNSVIGVTDEINTRSLIFEPIGLMKVSDTALLHTATGRLAVQICRC